MLLIMGSRVRVPPRSPIISCPARTDRQHHVPETWATTARGTDFRDWLFAGLGKAADEEGIHTSLGAGAASAPAIFDSGRDLGCGSRPVHCRMDLRGPSNRRLIRSMAVSRVSINRQTEQQSYAALRFSMTCRKFVANSR
jgi:hypothetical protein